MEDVSPTANMIKFWRIGVFYFLIIVVFGFYAVRLFVLQVVEGKEYLSQAEENRTTNISVQTQRGIIMDRNGYVLARNISSFNVVITPAYLPADEGAVQEVYRQLSALIDVPVNKGKTDDETVRLFKPCESDLGIAQIVYIGDTNAPYDPVPVKCDIDQKTAMIVMEKRSDWPGVGIEVLPVRDYPTGWLTSEIVGFLGPIPAALEKEYRDKGFVPGRDKVGYAGVEATMQEILGGRNGLRTVEVDVAGKEIRDLKPPLEPQPGYNVKLTIDTRLQMAAKEALIGEITGWNRYFNYIRSANGVAIAINPKTGEILAMVSYPTFENNRMARFIPAYYYEQLRRDPNRPLFNHAISAEHPPGSVYKMATAIGVINEGIMRPEDTIEDPGKITITQKFSPNDPGTPRDYVCWTETGHGIVDFIHAIAWSCDVYFYKVSGGYQNEVPKGLGVWLMKEYARALGYGELTGIELPGEAKGLVPDPTWKRLNVGENWATGDTYIAAMGQGFVLSTPLQVLVSFAVLANDGKYMKPTVIKEITDAEGNLVQIDENSVEIREYQDERGNLVREGKDKNGAPVREIIDPLGNRRVELLDVNGEVLAGYGPVLKWDITKDPRITIYDEKLFDTGKKKVVEPWVIAKAKEGMRLVTQPGGTAARQFVDMKIPSAGKTGTAEYCDNVAQSKNLCIPGSWPTHSWYVGYAPFDDPEIAVVAFVYNGGEGASVAAPIVRKILDSYFELKAIDSSGGFTE
ncbi:MAG: penicillin-binding protein 2 [Anaerolineae bacterium]|nr:penicillin-binding protein 2 [Anaerolineae bacterium]